MKKRVTVPVRGFLLHITHYDPDWNKVKAKEKPFDLKLGLEIIDTMAEEGFNLLVIDCSDGVKYKSHPELARHYSVPMSHLEALVARCGEKKIEVVPKLNFSQGTECHNYWFRPHDELFDNEEYWAKAFEVIDELIAVCRPPRFFHVGMDEDYARAYSQYIEAIKTLRTGLKKRGLRTVIWNDSCLSRRHWVFVEKCMTAEKKIPKDIVQVPWNYWSVPDPVVRRLAREGFDVWGAPGRDPAQIKKWQEAIEKFGGKGLLFTRWIPCQRANRKDLLGVLRTAGAALR